MTQKPAPAIVREVTEEDSEASVIGTPTNRVSHSRGFGDSGYKIQTVEFECPACFFDRMIRRWDVNPEAQDTVRYWCLNPNCGHYVRDSLSHACHGSYPQRNVREPTVYAQGDD